jgi:hypothetical protein
MWILYQVKIDTNCIYKLLRYFSKKTMLDIEYTYKTHLIRPKNIALLELDAIKF